LGAQALDSCDWNESLTQFTIVSSCFSSTPYAQEAMFYIGVSYFYLEEYDLANDAFSEYLKSQSNPRLFQEAVEYKYWIAECFKNGAKRRFFGTKKLPKWASGTSMALTIYDEVVAAVPCHDIAAQALVSKGYLLWTIREYRQSVDAFQMVIRRFPKHELAPECYLYISRVYLEQSRIEFQNPDILAFAQINLKKFQLDFPREDRLCEARENVQQIQEIYARGLYDTGRFYERTCKKRAALIYYHNAIHQFPDTCVAQLCQERILCLDPVGIVPYNYPLENEEAGGKEIDIDMEPFNDALEGV
jgi:outer membrane protein assembly factor BamD (BamD/ComL family)